MNKRVLISAVLAAVIVPGAMAFGQEGAQPAAPAPAVAQGQAQPAVNPIVEKVTEMNLWIQELVQSNSLPLDQQPSAVALVDHAFTLPYKDVQGNPITTQGRDGTTAYESLQGLYSYLEALDLRILNAHSNAGVVDPQFQQNYSSNQKVIKDLQNRIKIVTDAFESFIKVEQNRPKATTNNKKDPKNKGNYDDAVTKAANSLKTVLLSNLLDKSGAAILSPDKIGQLSDVCENLIPNNTTALATVSTSNSTN